MSFSLLNINYQNNNKNILNDISIDFTEKSIGVLGHNGSGKTTLMKILSGITKPTSGKVEFDKKNLKHISDLDRAKNIGYVQQDREYVIGFTLYEYVELGTFPNKNILDFKNNLDSKVILFDEPTSNLDLKNAHKVSSLIKKLNSHGIQTIVTSHDFRILKDISDFLCLLKNGVIVDFGKTKDVLTHENIINAFQLLPEHYSKIDSNEFKDL